MTSRDERIAALLDGRLTERERAELLAELGASDDDLEVLVDSAGIMAELEEGDRTAANRSAAVESEAADGRAAFIRRRWYVLGALVVAAALALALWITRRIG